MNRHKLMIQKSRMNHRLTFIVLIAIALILFAATTTFAALDPVDIVPDIPQVKVTFLNQDPNPAEPAKYVTVRFKVDNRGREDLKNMTFEILPEYPFSLDNPEDAQVNIGSLFGRQIDEFGAILEWKLRVDRNAIEGTNQIKLRYTYPGTKWITLSKFDLNVKTHDAIINIESYDTKPERVSSGNAVKVNIVLRNLADSVLKDIKTRLALPADFAPTGTSNEKTIKILDAGKSVAISYEIMVSKDAISKAYQIPFEMTYSDELGNLYAKNSTIGIIVDNPPKYAINLEQSDIYTTNNKGKIIVSFSDVGFSDINFARMRLLESEDYDILSTPMVYLGNLEPDDYETAEYEIYLHQNDTSSKSVPILLELEFTDDYNQDSKIRQSIDMPVYSAKDAQKYGYMNGSNKSNQVLFSIIGGMIFILLLVFWIQMMASAVTSKQPLAKKATWIFLLVTTLLIGAVLYYFFGRKAD